MRFSSISVFSLLSVVLPLSVSATPFEVDVAERSVDLDKRAFDARVTVVDYNIVTSCGSFYSNDDFVVALNSEQYGSGEYCNKPIDITINGKTIRAQVVDVCPSCGYPNLDISPSLFEQWADISTGVLFGSWDFA